MRVFLTLQRYNLFFTYTSIYEKKIMNFADSYYRVWRILTIEFGGKLL